MPQAKANGITIEYETFGDPKAEPMLLIMGLGAQMTRWPPEFCQKIADRGFHVIRYDNRDVGLTTHFDGAPIPTMQEVSARRAKGEPLGVAYTLSDMAADGMGLLDTLGVKKAHIVGASMGGMIAQMVAIEHPDRVLSLTSIFSNTGNPAIQAKPEAMAVLVNRPPNPFENEEGYLAHTVASARVTGSPAYPADEAVLRANALADVKRAYNPAGFGRQMAAISATGDRREQLKGVTAPTIVIHGEADPLVPVEGGRDTAAHIPGAEIVTFPGMGHDLPPVLWDKIIDAIVSVTVRARASA
jgi:pimeloyl-ACP methyl ester carboxylesterase